MFVYSQDLSFYEYDDIIRMSMNLLNRYYSAHNELFSNAVQAQVYMYTYKGEHLIAINEYFVKEKFPWKLLLLIPYCYMGELCGFQRSPFSRKRSINGNGLIKAPDFLICVPKQTIKTIKHLHKFALPPPLQIKMISLYC